MAKSDQHELSEEAIDRITRVVHSLADDRVERGVDLGRPMHCDSCDAEKPSAGSALYGAYKLCNECLLDFTLALASGRVDNVVDYMTKRSDGPDLTPPPSGLAAPDGRRSVSLNPLQRDKLLPRNEPC